MLAICPPNVETAQAAQDGSSLLLRFSTEEQVQILLLGAAKLVRTNKMYRSYVISRPQYGKIIP